MNSFKKINRALSLELKLAIFTILFTVFSVAIVGIISFKSSSKSLKELSIEQLNVQGENIKTTLEDYFKRTNRLTDKLSRDRLIEGLLIAYESNFFGSSFTPGEDYKINNEFYLKLDEKYIERKQKILADFQLSDFLLVTLDSQIVSVANIANQETFLGKNLNNGVYKGTPLHTCYTNALNSETGQVFFSDFFYDGVTKTSVGFMCKKKLAEFDNMDEGISKGDDLGVVITQFDNQLINKIASSRTGMGKTGQAYLVGSDRLLRSDFFLEKDKYNSALSLKENKQIKTKQIDLALKGKTGGMITIDPLGHKVLSYYGHFKIFDQNWAMIAEKQYDEVMAPVSDMITSILIATFIVVSIALVMILILLKKILKPIIERNNELQQISENLSENSTTLKKSAEGLDETANLISDSTNQTVSTLEELRQMIAKTLDSVSYSKEKSQEMNEKAQEGQKSVTQMKVAVNDIQLNNDQTVEVLNEIVSNIEEFKNVIETIASKTVVINDIVFQTKLLSFNASVEAARAGEMGKGFSVVAEEVGTLATQSGKAANEISELLQNSTNKVNSIVQSTKSKIGDISEKGQEKIKKGNETVELCSSALDEIISRVEEVSMRISDINNASAEQSKGVESVGDSMHSLLQITRDTLKIAEGNNTAASELSEEAHNLDIVYNSLNDIIRGSKNIPQQTEEDEGTVIPMPQNNNDGFEDLDLDDDDFDDKKYNI